jgi:hypothetical protein
MIGFSAHYTNAFSARLEQRSTHIDRHYRSGSLELMTALNTLHDASDAAIAGEGAAAEAHLDAGLRQLASCNDHLSQMAEELVRSRVELFERAGVDPCDPLVAREAQFARLDFDGLYREMAAHGAALPQRVYWDDVASRLRDGGARAGLRLLDRHVRELQSDLRSLVGQVEVLRSLPLAELGPALHEMSIAAAAPVLGFARLVAVFTYVSIACERASQMHEAAGMTEAVAAAG